MSKYIQNFTYNSSHLLTPTKELNIINVIEEKFNNKKIANIILKQLDDVGYVVIRNTNVDINSQS